MKTHVIIIHEVYGITENLVKLKTMLEKKGLTVSLPSLYPDNYIESDEKLAYELFYSRVGLNKAYDIINEIISTNLNQQIILLGFSIGATIGWLHSENSSLYQVICVYGSRIRNYMDREPKAKTDLFFCRENHFDAEKLSLLLNHKSKVCSSMIDGDHGF